jgi:NADH:ubiquinone oxidoreductase subunit 5 (subunit L)/multisubunit Na+/H+ antiporter MnhA subunit
MPVFGTILIFTSMASLGLPGLNGFVSEFMIVRGSWSIFTVQLAISMLGLLMTGAYILKGIGETLHGPVKPQWARLPDMTAARTPGHLAAHGPHAQPGHLAAVDFGVYQRHDYETFLMPRSSTSPRS